MGRVVHLSAYRQRRLADSQLGNVQRSAYVKNQLQAGRREGQRGQRLCRVERPVEPYVGQQGRAGAIETERIGVHDTNIDDLSVMALKTVAILGRSANRVRKTFHLFCNADDGHFRPFHYFCRPRPLDGQPNETVKCWSLYQFSFKIYEELNL